MDYSFLCNYLVYIYIYTSVGAIAPVCIYFLNIRDIILVGNNMIMLLS